MSSPTVLQIMQAIQTRLATIDGLSASLFSPSQVTPPEACVDFTGVNTYRSTMGRGYWEPSFTVTVYTSDSDAFAGQAQLADLASASGVRAAVEGDRTLGGTVADCVVQSYEPKGLEPVGQIQCYVGTFILHVIAPGA
jgi:hypothetical protein